MRSWNFYRVLSHALVAIALMAPSAYSHGGGGHGHAGGEGLYFDPDTIVSLSGVLSREFDDWEVWGHGNHTGGGMHFEFETDNGEHYDLMLAPEWHLEEQGIVLRNGDRISVTGSVVETYFDNHSGGGHMGQHMSDDQDFLIATSVSAGGITLELRDEEGYPLWRGGPGWNGMPWFDSDTVTNMRGELETSLGLWSCWGVGNYTGNGMHYLFNSNQGETLYAMLAPWWYLQDHGIVLEDGLKVRLTGSVVEPYWQGYDEHRYIIATQIKAGGVTVRLRDEYGYPLWHGTGWHYYSPPYDEGTSATLEGNVARVRTRTNGRGLDPGAEVVMRSGGRRYVVFLAPQWHVQGMGLDLAKGVEIKIRGAVLHSGNRKEVVARSVEAHGERWHLRNARGYPLWINGTR